MKILGVLLLCCLAGLQPISAGTFTTSETLIPVAPTATATEAGDTTGSAGAVIHLDARVYVPDGVVAPAPVVIIVHGYAGSKDDEIVVTLAEDFAAEGYVVLTPTARGFGDSDGLVTLVGPNEVNDLKTIILAMQTGSIGDTPPITVPVSTASNFGVTGASYGGGHSFEIMRTQVDGLVAVAPIIGWTDLYQALAPNDVPKFSFTVGLFASGFDPLFPNYDDVMFDWMGDLLSGRPENTRTGGPQENIDWRSVLFDPAQLTVPVFVVQGWRDWLFPAEQATALFEASTSIPFFKLYLGGLGHPPAEATIDNPEALYLRAKLLDWFDYWLKGIDTGIVAEPRVTVAPELTASWSEAALVHAATFPLPGTTTTTYFINDGNLSTSGPSGDPKSIQPTTGIPLTLLPIREALGGDAIAVLAAVVAVNDVLNSGDGITDPDIATGLDGNANAKTFNSAQLTQPLHVVGIPQIQFYVSASRSNAWYFVQVQEQTRDRRVRLITRGAFKDHSSSPQTAHAIEFGLFGVNHTFQAGSRIKLRVSSRDFPFFLPNLNQPTVKIYRDTQRPSQIDFPVVP